MVSTQVQFGNLMLTVSGEDVLAVIQEVERINALNEVATQEGLTLDQVTPFYRKINNYEYFGFRRLSDNAEVNFGKSGSRGVADDYFPYRKGYVNPSNPQAAYKGFKRPDFSGEAPPIAPPQPSY